MNVQNNPSRRKILKTGLAALGASTVLSPKGFAAPKKPGEVRVLFLFGDYWHNGMTQEIHWRRILGVTGWRLLFAQTSRAVTPEILAETDLFVFSRYAGIDYPAWSGAEIVETRPAGEVWMSDEQEDAIIENVHRGMGLLPYHCAIWNADKKKFLALLGVKKPLVHGNIREMTSFYDLNQAHPITRDVEPFEEVDEIFDAEMLDVEYELLFRARQKAPSVENPPAWIREYGDAMGAKYKGPILDRPGGWTREVGDGRIVFLNAGSTPEIFWKKSMKEIMWRSAHWAMKMAIPESRFVEGHGRDRE